MKKIAYITIISFILIIGILVIKYFCGPHSLYELYEENYMNISSEYGTSAFDYFNVQSYGDYKIFLDEGNLVEQKQNTTTKNILRKNVEQFLVWNGKLVYILFDFNKKIFIKGFHSHSGEIEKVFDNNIVLLLCDKNYLYVYLDNNILYKFDSRLMVIEKINLSNMNSEEKVEKACIFNKRIIFVTEAMRLYVYNMDSKDYDELYMKKEKDYSHEVDVIQCNGEIYYMLSYYNDGDMHNFITRESLGQSGIYKLDVEKGKFIKISEDTGDIMVNMNNQLYVADLSWIGLSYRMNGVILDEKTD